MSEVSKVAVPTRITVLPERKAKTKVEVRIFLYCHHSRELENLKMMFLKSKILRRQFQLEIVVGILLSFKMARCILQTCLKRWLEMRSPSFSSNSFIQYEMAELTNLSFCETSLAIKCFKSSAVGFSCFSSSSTAVNASLWRSWEKFESCGKSKSVIKASHRVKIRLKHQPQSRTRMASA